MDQPQEIMKNFKCKLIETKRDETRRNTHTKKTQSKKLQPKRQLLLVFLLLLCAKWLRKEKRKNSEKNNSQSFTPFLGTSAEVKLSHGVWAALSRNVWMYLNALTTPFVCLFPLTLPLSITRSTGLCGFEACPTRSTCVRVYFKTHRSAAQLKQRS